MRLFVALDLPPATKRRLGEAMGRWRSKLPAARWVATENLHLTLAFLGETAASALPGIEAALAERLRACAPIAARLERAGCFPDRGPARIAWLGLEPARELEALAAATREALVAAAAAFDDKPFRPHVTLARCAPAWPAPARGRWQELAAPLVGEALSWRVASLFESVLGPGGARYRTLAEVPLAGAP